MWGFFCFRFQDSLLELLTLLPWLAAGVPGRLYFQSSQWEETRPWVLRYIFCICVNSSAQRLDDCLLSLTSQSPHSRWSKQVPFLLNLYVCAYMHVCVPRHMCEGIGQLEEVSSVFSSCRFWDSAHIAHCQAYQQALLYSEILSCPKCCSWPPSSIVTSSIWLSDLLSLESSSAHFPATGHHWRSSFFHV